MKKKGDALPRQFAGGEDIDMDSIIELEPDVILAPWSGITQDQYDLLSDIAPTVAYPDEAWSTDWDEQIERVAKALGEPDRGSGLIRDPARRSRSRSCTPRSPRSARARWSPATTTPSSPPPPSSTR